MSNLSTLLSAYGFHVSSNHSSVRYQLLAVLGDVSVVLQDICDGRRHVSIQHKGVGTLTLNDVDGSILNDMMLFNIIPDIASR